MSEDGGVSDPVDGGHQMPRPTGRSTGQLRKTVKDMVLSMAVVLALVFVIVLLAWRPTPQVVNVIDPAPAISQATNQADFPLVAPSGLSEDWRPTSARWEPSPESGSDPVFHIGYVTPTDQYGQVSLSRAATERYLGEQTSGGRPIDTREVDGAVWQRWEADDRRSLVLIDGGVTTIVSGTGEWSEIEGLAATLQPVS
jgi:Protein of unknown function (DUF4245)